MRRIPELSVLRRYRTFQERGHSLQMESDVRSTVQKYGRAREAAEVVTTVQVPDIGDFADVPVIDVLVKPGDTVAVETPLVTVESEKASMDIPAPSAGVVASVLVKLGDRVSKGSPIITLESAAGSGNGVAAEPASVAAEPAPVAAEPTPEVKDAASAASTAPPQQSQGAAVHASPSLRRFARELGVELQRVTGTGPQGRITRDDVQSFVKSALAAPSAASRGGAPFDLPPWPKVDFASFGPIERKPLPRIKKISGPVLHRNWVMIPHVTNNDEADITELEAFRQKLGAEDPTAKTTILAFLIKAVVAALQRFPEFNASLDGDDLVLRKYYNIGFAADTPSGLVVPVIRNADTMGVLALGAQTRALSAKARDGKLLLAEMQGGTFTISSLGGIGGTSFSPIINAPEVAILGVSRAATRAVWNGSEFVPRLMLPLSLSYDHRVIDGAAAARFNAFLAALLGDLRRSLL